LSFLSGCASSGSATSRPAESRVINFLDTKHGVKMVYTSDWGEQSFLKPSGAIIMLTRGREVLSLVADDQDQQLTAAQLAALDQRAVEEYQRQFGEFKLIEQAETTFASEPARRTVFSGKKLGVKFQAMQVLAVRGGRTYVFLYMSNPTDYPKGQPEAQKIMDTIEFVR
jgi:hypothetical protein